MFGLEGVFHGQAEEEGSRCTSRAQAAYGSLQGTGGAGSAARGQDDGAAVPGIRPAANQITEWKRQLLERAADVFGGADPPKPVDLQPLHIKTGQLTLENFFFGAQGAVTLIWRSCSATNIHQMDSYAARANGYGRRGFALVYLAGWPVDKACSPAG